MDADILVIGGGPIGSHTARRLAEAGYKVIVIEKRKVIGGPICCTGIVSQKCLEEFSINNSLILKQFKGAKVYSPSGRQFKIKREKIQACVIDRPLFDREMVKRAEMSGAIFYLGTKANSFETNKKGVEVKTNKNGKARSFKGKALVISCGFSSNILANYHRREIDDYAVGAQAEVETNCQEDVEVYTGTRFTPGFFGWLVPISLSKARIGLISRNDSQKRLRYFIKELQSSGRIKKIIHPIKSRHIPLRTLKKTYGERLLVVGDAAGQVKPTTGGGIYFGLISAEAAAKQLIRALEKDDFTESCLATYERSWKKKIGNDINYGLMARRFYEMLGDKQLDRVFDIIFTDNIINNILKDESIAFDWHGGLFFSLFKKQIMTKIFRALGIK